MVDTSTFNRQTTENSAATWRGKDRRGGEQQGRGTPPTPEGWGARGGGGVGGGTRPPATRNVKTSQPLGAPSPRHPLVAAPPFEPPPWAPQLACSIIAIIGPVRA